MPAPRSNEARQALLAMLLSAGGEACLPACLPARLPNTGSGIFLPALPLLA
jgi:hypothetical protein